MHRKYEINTKLPAEGYMIIAFLIQYKCSTLLALRRSHHLWEHMSMVTTTRRCQGLTYLQDCANQLPNRR
jgi:hypothetical protein